MPAPPFESIAGSMPSRMAEPLLARTTSCEQPCTCCVRFQAWDRQGQLCFADLSDPLIACLIATQPHLAWVTGCPIHPGVPNLSDEYRQVQLREGRHEGLTVRLKTTRCHNLCAWELICAAAAAGNKTHSYRSYNCIYICKLLSGW